VAFFPATPRRVAALDVHLLHVEGDELVHAKPGLEEEREHGEGPLSGRLLARGREQGAQLGGRGHIGLPVVRPLEGKPGGGVGRPLGAEQDAQRDQFEVPGGGRGRAPRATISGEESLDVGPLGVLGGAVTQELQERPRDAEVGRDRLRTGRGRDEVALEGAEVFGSHKARRGGKPLPQHPARRARSTRGRGGSKRYQVLEPLA
jgi:hypothetical protein